VRRFILARQDEPWGVYVNFQMTHFPYKLPPGARGPFAPATPDPKTFRYLSYPESELESAQNRYDNALRYVDEQVGQLYDALVKSDQIDNTIIVLTSDHGELFHQHGMVTHGRSLYEAEARVPLLIHWPSTVRPRASDAPVSHLDILPTLAELIGVAPHPAFQGESFAEPELVDPERKAIFLNIQGMRTVEGIVCWPYKLIKARQQRHPELYDLSRDPREQEDLFFKDSERVTRLEHLLKAQMSAQLHYHHPKNQALRDERYAPRLLTCDAPLD
jgi:arylsulfatase A-like enzyme